MKQLDKSDILQMPKRQRAQLINSCGGLKSANLIGSIDGNGTKNLAIFNSVMHLGSHPPMLCFMLRPTTVSRNTYNNIKKTGDFTVNHIHPEMLQQAHQTSAKYEADISEFDEVGLRSMHTRRIKSPYMEDALVKIGCSFKNEYFIEENGCRLIIGEMEELLFSEDLQLDDGSIDLLAAQSVGAIGLDTYIAANLLGKFDYARPETAKASTNGQAH